MHEEVARVYGYDNIDYNQNFSSSYSCINLDRYSMIKKISSILSSNGFNEHYSNSLLSKDENKLFSSGMDVEILNPLSRDMKYLRNSIIPGLLRALSYNINHGNKNFKLFESGTIHKKIKLKSKFKYIQENHLGMIWNYSESKDWKEKDKIDLYMVKGEISHLFLNIGNPIEFNNINNQLNISCRGKRIGRIIDSNSLKLKLFEKKSEIFLAEFNLDDIIKIIDSINKDSEDLADIRDEALILIGFYSFCRRSEVLNMKYEDLTFNNDSITVSIKYSKTDQKGEGRQVLLPKKDDRYCPVKSLKKWIEIAQIANGPLFYKITKSKNKASFERIRKYELNNK